MSRPQSNVITSYAQNFEDVILKAYFHGVEKGFYVDVGSNHPVIDSVTNLFYESGWSGLNIEPLPNIFEELKMLRKRDINIQSAIGSEEGTAILHVYHTKGGYNGLSTLSSEQEATLDDEKRKDVLSKEDIEVKILPLRKVLSSNLNKNQHIHFMKIDVEGLELDVLNSNDWSKYRPEVICLEANHVYEEWKEVLLKNGYVKDFFDGLNEYYVEKQSRRTITSYYEEEVLNKLYVKFNARTALSEEHKVSEEILARKLKKSESVNRHLLEIISILENESVRKSKFKFDARSILIKKPAKLLSLIEQKIDELNSPKIKVSKNISIKRSDDLGVLLKKVGEFDKVFIDGPKVPYFRRKIHKLLKFIFNKFYVLLRRCRRVLGATKRRLAT